jgi:hypothetical protein
MHACMPWYYNHRFSWGCFVCNPTELARFIVVIDVLFSGCHLTYGRGTPTKLDYICLMYCCSLICRTSLYDVANHHTREFETEGFFSTLSNRLWMLFNPVIRMWSDLASYYPHVIRRLYACMVSNLIGHMLCERCMHGRYTCT